MVCRHQSLLLSRPETDDNGSMTTAEHAGERNQVGEANGLDGAAALVFHWAPPAFISLALIALVVLWYGGGVASTALWPQQHVLFLRWNAAAASIPSEVWSAITLLGDAAVAMALFAWLICARPPTWAALLASVPAGALISLTAKHSAAALRPGAVLDSATFNVVGPVLQHNSFPSGHSISAFAFAAAVLATCVASPKAWRDKALVLAVLAAAAAVSVSRVAVGAHWPLDIVAGAALGWLAGLSGAALARYTGWWTWLFLGAGRPAVGAALIAWGVLLWLRPHETFSCLMVVGLAGLCATGVGGVVLLRVAAQRSQSSAEQRA